MDLLRIFSVAHRELRPRTPIPDIHVEFFPFAGINHTARLREGSLRIRVSDIFAVAPEDMQRCLALILLAKLYRKKIDAEFHRSYRSFILRSEIQEMARIAKKSRGRTSRPLNSRGKHIDLAAIFDRLNAVYFGGMLDKARLSWSPKPSRRILGRYDSAGHTIFISPIFDSPSVPLHVTEYIMYHEMLHIKHETRVRDCRMMVHTPEFKNDERRFEQYREARLWLKSL